MCSNDNPFQYQATNNRYIAGRPVTAEEIVNEAKRITANKFRRGVVLTNPAASRDFLIQQLSDLEQEVFACVFLDNRNRIIQFEILFRGTIDGAAVYPREIVKRALALNAAAIIMAHNHPSGVAEPSRADEAITRKVVSALDLIEVRVLDHFIVAGEVAESLVERGLVI